MGKAMQELKEMLHVELDKISRGGDLTPSKLDLVDKLTHSIKSIETIEAMQEYGDDGYSYGYSYRGRRGNVKRDSMGRYAREGEHSYRNPRRDDYARDDGSKEEVKHRLHELMEDTTDHNVRMAIQRAMDEL